MSGGAPAGVLGAPDADALTGGFADPVFDSQATFRAVLDALARPGRVAPLAVRVAPPAALSATAGAVVAALADEATPVWLAPSLRAGGAARWIAFHTGAPVTESGEAAAFAVVADARETPPLDRFAQGTAEYPDRSTTVILTVEGFGAGPALRLTGPGVAGATTLRFSPAPERFVADLAANRARFPRGVDIILAAPGGIVGLPRSVRIVEA